MVCLMFTWSGLSMLCLTFSILCNTPSTLMKPLSFLEDALECFHNNKEIFVNLGIWDMFNIQKLHFTRHCLKYIKLYGTLDNLNTEYTERLHIDLAKDAYAATNHKDEFIQMTIWLEHEEQILCHHQYVELWLKGFPPPLQVEWIPPGLEINHIIKLTKYPTAQAISFNVLVAKYGATHFYMALTHFIALTNNPNLICAQLEWQLWEIWIPFNKLPVCTTSSLYKQIHWHWKSQPLTQFIVIWGGVIHVETLLLAISTQH